MSGSRSSNTHKQGWMLARLWKRGSSAREAGSSEEPTATTPSIEPPLIPAYALYASASPYASLDTTMSPPSSGQGGRADRRGSTSTDSIRAAPFTLVESTSVVPSSRLAYSLNPDSGPSEDQQFQGPRMGEPSRSSRAPYAMPASPTNSWTPQDDVAFRATRKAASERTATEGSDSESPSRSHAEREELAEGSDDDEPHPQSRSTDEVPRLHPPGPLQPAIPMVLLNPPEGGGVGQEAPTQPNVAPALSSRLIPPVRTFGVAASLADPSFYDTSKPTCTLNLVCYRSGARGCHMEQVQVALHSKFPDSEAFVKYLSGKEHIMTTDKRLIREMRRLYEMKMCGTIRRLVSLKSLKTFRVLAYTPTSRPTVVPLDEFVLQEMMYAYRNPSSIITDDEWIRWVFNLRRKDKRHAVEFVEGWDTTRVAIAGSVPWVTSCLVGLVWTAMGGDPQTTFTVAGFILTSATVILALLAIISGIESSGRPY